MLLCIQLVKVIRQNWQLFDSVKQPRMRLPHLFPDTSFVYAHENCVDIMFRNAEIHKMAQNPAFASKNPEFVLTLDDRSFWSKLRAIVTLFKPLSKAIPLLDPTMEQPIKFSHSLKAGSH